MRSFRAPMLRLAPRIALVAAALALVGGAAQAKKKEPKPDNLVAVGKPVDCISPSRLRNTRVIDDQTIDFVMYNGDIYRNRLPYSCPSLKFEERFAYKLQTDQLCSIDMITVLQSLGGGLRQGASCGLGPFQKMEKAPPAN